MFQHENKRLAKNEKVTKLRAEMVKTDHADSDKLTKFSLKSDQAPKLDLTKKQQALLKQVDGEMGLKQLMKLLGQTHRTHFKNKHLAPLLEASLLAMKYPDNPNHPEQAYYLTGQGDALKRELIG